jgi:hypothetical protein
MSCCVSNDFNDRKMTYQIELVLFVNIGILSQNEEHGSHHSVLQEGAKQLERQDRFAANSTVWNP